MTIKRWSSVVALLLVSAAAARADIAPMPHPGYSLTPQTETRVRMARERVDIHIGERPDRRYYTHLAKVTAQFEMVNDTPDTVSLEVGFPVEALFISHADWAVKELVSGEPASPPDADEIVAQETRARFEEWGYYQFRASIDGGEEFSPDAVKEKGLLHHGGYTPEYLWFHWDMSFAPGTTLVEVSYEIPSVYSKGGAYQNIGYVLYSGSYWAGTIGSAVVAVHFPESAPPVKPALRTTPGFERMPHTLTWTYHDFEPGPRDNINIEFIPPDVAHAIHDLCEHVDGHPEDSDAMLELARLHIDASTRESDWPEGFDYSGLPETLLERGLEIDPGNCLAWNVYLSWCLGIRDRRAGMEFYQGEPKGRRRALIARAHEACPDDPGIAIWHELLIPEMWKSPEFERRAAKRLAWHDYELQTTYPIAVKGPRWIPPEQAQEIIEERMAEVLRVLASEDFDEIADLVHPTKGVRISIDAYMSDEDLHFTHNDVVLAPGDTTRLLAGLADGTGFEVWKTARQLLTIRTVPTDKVGYNKILGTGNTINNLFEFFPEGIVVEYHSVGSKERGGIDWYSRRFVLEAHEGDWYLVGIATDHWTI